MAYNITFNFDNLNKEQAHILGRLQKTFPNDTIDASLLKELSNIERVKNKEFEKIALDKDKILKGRFTGLAKGQTQALKTLLLDFLFIFQK